VNYDEVVDCPIQISILKKYNLKYSKYELLLITDNKKVSSKGRKCYSPLKSSAMGTLASRLSKTEANIFPKASS
jgi:hypothetical protein